MTAFASAKEFHIYDSLNKHLEKNINMMSLSLECLHVSALSDSYSKQVNKSTQKLPDL